MTDNRVQQNDRHPITSHLRTRILPSRTLSATDSRGRTGGSVPSTPPPGTRTNRLHWTKSNRPRNPVSDLPGTNAVRHGGRAQACASSMRSGCRPETCHNATCASWAQSLNRRPAEAVSSTEIPHRSLCHPRPPKFLLEAPSGSKHPNLVLELGAGFGTRFG